jgi:hypothetical protein
MEIKCTMDYSQFFPHPHNRPMDERTVKLIMADMQQNGSDWSEPIVVHSDGAIVNGQHRYESEKRLGLPVYYVVNDEMTPERARAHGTIARKWSAYDCIASYASQGLEDYIWLADYLIEHPINIHIIYFAFSGGFEEKRRSLKSGTFSISGEERRFLLRLWTVLQDFAPILPSWKSIAFVSAVASLLRDPQYNHQQMMQRLSYQSTRLVRCATRNAYTELLEQIYNYKSQTENRVRFSRVK